MAGARVTDRGLMNRASVIWGSAVVVCGAITACSKNDGTADTAAPAAVVVADSASGVAVATEVAPGVIMSVAAPPGTAVHLADGQGRAMYVLEDPSGAVAVCTGECLANWVPVPGGATAAPGDTTVRSDMIRSRPGPDGTMQATYNGKPLYYYRGDRSPGDATGQGMTEGGVTGRLVSPSGETSKR